MTTFGGMIRMTFSFEEWGLLVKAMEDIGEPPGTVWFVHLFRYHEVPNVETTYRYYQCVLDRGPFPFHTSHHRHRKDAINEFIRMYTQLKAQYTKAVVKDV